MPTKTKKAAEAATPTPASSEISDEALNAAAGLSADSDSDDNEAQARKLVPLIDLSIRCSPVLAAAGDSEPVEMIQRDDDTYEVLSNPNRPQTVNADEAKLMRARFMYLRSRLYQGWDTLSQERREWATECYFDGQDPHDPKIKKIIEDAIAKVSDLGDKIGVPVFLNDVQIAGPVNAKTAKATDDADDAVADPTDAKTFASVAKVIDDPLSVQLTKQQLQGALAIVRPFVSKRSTLPILEHVKVTRRAQPYSSLRIEATNLEVGIAVDLPLAGMLPEEGATTLPAGRFAEFVATLPADALVKLTTDPTSGLKTKIETPRSRATLNSGKPSEFPTLGLGDFDAPDTPIARVNAKALRLLIDSVASAAAKDDARPIFTSIYLEFGESKITATAADSYRLSSMSVAAEVPSALVNRTALVPAKPFETIMSVLPLDGEIEMALKPQGTQIVFRALGENVTVSCVSNLLSGQFPAFQAIIPKNEGDDTVARFDRKLAIKAVKAAYIFARDNANIVRIFIDAEAKTLTLTSSADDIGDTAQVLDGIEVMGPSGTIIFNIVLLRDALNVMTGEHVDLRISMKPAGLGKTPTTSERPATLRTPDGEPEQSESYVGVVMPMYDTREKK